jgi:hypothetical protein
MIAEALQASRSFYVIHFASTAKFNIFPLSPDPYQQSQFERRKIAEVDLGAAAALRVPVAIAEDTLLMKLVWYRSGGVRASVE